MGACSSRPWVLEDEAGMPRQSEVDHSTNEETTTVEAAPDEIQVPAKEAEAVEDQEVLPSVVEKHGVEAGDTPAAAEEGPTESEDSNKVHEVADVGESNKEETPATGDVSDNVESVAEPVETYTTLPSEEAAQDSAVPETEGKANTSKSTAEDVQHGSASSEPESEKKTDSFESVAQPLPAKATREESGSVPAQPPSAAAGNPFQAFISNVTRGWGWH